MLHMRHITDPLTGTTFNDYEVLAPKHPLGLETDDTKFDYVTQVCLGCTKEHRLADGLDLGMGSRRCGVVGCENPAVHLYRFMVKGDPAVDELGRPTPTVTRPVTPRKIPPTETPPTTLRGIK